MYWSLVMSHRSEDEDPILGRLRRLEIDAPDEPVARLRVAPVTDEERERLRCYLEALDNAEGKHPTIPLPWHRLREVIVESERSERSPRRVYTRDTRNDIFYRVASDPTGFAAIDVGMVICRTHVVELVDYRFAGRQLKVRALGVRERRALDFAFSENVFGSRTTISLCAMCQAVVAHGNVCHSDVCKTPLHPQWPAVYCSNRCALEDA